MQTILTMYITLMSVILAGVTNMVFCKHPVLESSNRPMDAGRYWPKDQKRLLGANKTWKGFFGMIVFGTLFQILWGLLSSISPLLENHNYIYQNQPNTIGLNTVVGFSLGLAYVLFELPNSFIKRRLDIKPGKQANNHLRWLFIIIDQIDSLLGCTLVLAALIPMTLGRYTGFVLLGGISHLAINQILYKLNLRRNPY